MAPVPRVLAAALLLASLAAAPVLAASSTHDEMLVPTATGHDVASSHAYQLELEDGESLTATLTWDGPNAARADLDLTLAAPDATCSASPDPEAGCLADHAESRVLSAACQGARDPGATDGRGPGTETATRTAGDDGTWTAYVVASLAVPGDPVRYTLDLATSADGADTTEGPERTVLVRPDGHCHHAPATPGTPSAPVLP